MKEANSKEELYSLSGWDHIEDNLSQSGIYTKRPQQQTQKVVNSKLPQAPTIPNRTHLRNRSKEYLTSKTISNPPKSDKEFLQQYIKRLKASSPEPQNCIPQDPSPGQRIICHTGIDDSKSAGHHQHKISEILISGNKSSQESSLMLEKYRLFSGTTKQKCKKRRYFLKTHSKEVVQKKIYKDTGSLFHKSSQMIMPQRLNFQKVEQMEFDRVDFHASHKKGVKFPLFYRQLLSNDQRLRKDKYKSTINLRQKIEMKFSEEFTDDNIFQTRFIRA